MEKKSISVNYTLYNSLEELPKDEQELMIVAKKALNQAYAVYSGFKVGAGLLLEDGNIVTGNNQENIAFPSSLCAERVALYYSKANHPDKAVKKIAITAHSHNEILGEPVSPCGSCRQVMAEYERLQNEPMKVILMGEEGKVVTFETVAELLPFAFITEALNKIES